jgi:RNA polymerase sigma-70 factor (ECF subfamily)
MNLTDLTILVQRAQTGDREAYGALVHRFYNIVYATALDRLRNPNEAQELTQDVFVHAMQKLPQLLDARCLGGWLRQITARMAINRLTRRARWVGTDPEFLDAIEAKGQTADETCDTREAIEQLEHGLARLKPIDRQTLEAYYLRGRSLKQMAKEFAVPTGTIKRRLHTARLRLKKELEEIDPLLAEQFASHGVKAVAV